MKQHDRGRLVCVGGLAPTEGHCFVANLPDLPAGDSIDDPSGSALVLFEDGVEMGPPHALHETIRRTGAGRYSHWHHTLYLSSSDNTDPRVNGRSYHVYVPEAVRPPLQRALGTLAGLVADHSEAAAYAAIEHCLALLYPRAKLGEDLKSYWNDEAFISDYRRLAGHNYRSLERKYTIYQLVCSLGWLAGDIAECGVYNGASSYFMALAGARCGVQRELHLFDSFAGLSPPEAADGLYWQAGDLACDEDTARRNLAGFPGIHIYPGWIPTRFAAVAERRFCFVHVDVDLYRPTSDSLAFFYPRLAPGGMLVCDDYGFDSCPGARRALDEFFAGRRERIIHLPTGQGLVIKSPSSADG
jgi:hypothetical protein